MLIANSNTAKILACFLIGQYFVEAARIRDRRVNFAEESSRGKDSRRWKEALAQQEKVFTNLAFELPDLDSIAPSLPVHDIRGTLVDYSKTKAEVKQPSFLQINKEENAPDPLSMAAMPLSMPPPSPPPNDYPFDQVSLQGTTLGSSQANPSTCVGCTQNVQLSQFGTSGALPSSYLQQQFPDPTMSQFGGIGGEMPSFPQAQSFSGAFQPQTEMSMPPVIANSNQRRIDLKRLADLEDQIQLQALIEKRTQTWIDDHERRLAEWLQSAKMRFGASVEILKSQLPAIEQRLHYLNTMRESLVKQLTSFGDQAKREQANERLRLYQNRLSALNSQENALKTQIEEKKTNKQKLLDEIKKLESESNQATKGQVTQPDTTAHDAAPSEDVDSSPNDQ